MEIYHVYYSNFTHSYHTTFEAARAAGMEATTDRLPIEVQEFNDDFTGLMLRVGNGPTGFEIYKGKLEQ